MKLFSAALFLLLLLLGRTALSQTQRPDTATTIRLSIEAPAPPLTIDSVDYLKAVAINQALFKNFSGQFFFSSGYAAAQYGGLNGMLEQAGYPEVDGGQFSYGAGGSFRFKHFVLGLEAVMYDIKKKTTDRQTELFSSNATNYIGYAWLNDRRTACFTPTIGVTYGSADITLTEKNATSGTGSATGLLAGPAYSRTLHYRSSGLALGAHYEFYPFDAAVLKRCVVGLHTTYTAPLGSGHYYVDDFKQKVEGPKLNPLLFSARVVVGFVF
ncbi:hypothetical protein [Hymenobacter metallicola]|uniref:Outer membrane protein beta-barrel domain-containing protein n=1 Tax=Hymenobacter metallicola TaxID=2563114 RepID=A0A4Z0QLK3_9BACT|nr:hypothetical protein [Hymenobacter metallicola]TGE29612.1 hypothetical protein E5K02_09210 [Hymenobacter metallicola]